MKAYKLNNLQWIQFVSFLLWFCSVYQELIIDYVYIVQDVISNELNDSFSILLENIVHIW